jgi:hypothetical protein
MNAYRICLIIFAIFLLETTQGLASPTSKLTREVVERVLRESAERSRREVLKGTERRSAIETLERLSGKYGDDVLKLAHDGGLELIEAVPRFGDEVFEIAIKASPEARRALARGIPELLPLAKSVGVEAIELEARTPGLALKTFSTFGDNGGRIIAKSAPTEDVPRLLSYGDKADSKATRDLLLEQYQKEGKSIFERIPAKLVLAHGLSAAMLYGTHRGTDPLQATGDAIRKNKDLAKDAITQFSLFGGLVVLVLTALLLWRFGLMPWQRPKVAANSAEKNYEQDRGGQQTTPPS